MGLSPAGIGVSALLQIRANGHLPEDIATRVDKILDELEIWQESVVQSGILLKKLIKLTMSYKPINFKEYIWYAKFSVAFLLLTNTSESLFSSRIDMISHAFITPTDMWITDIVKTHTVAKAIYSVSSDFSNIVFVVTNISDCTTFTFLVSVCLMWTAFFDLAGQPVTAFRLYTTDDIISLISTVPGLNVTSGTIDMKCIYNFTNLYTVYQSLVFYNPVAQNNDKLICYKQYLQFDETQLRFLRDYWKKVQSKLDPFSWQCEVQNNDTDQFLGYDILRLITFDILDKLNQHFRQEEYSLLLNG